MSTSLSLKTLIISSFETTLDEFVKVTDDVINQLRDETSQIGNMEVNGKLIRVFPEGEAIVVGDIHGDLESLAQILKFTEFLHKASSGSPVLLIFLGDYGDRGVSSPEVYHVVLKLKQSFPEKVVLLRGNHEGPEDLLASPHDLPVHLHERFGDGWAGAYSKLQDLFDQLYNAVVVGDKWVLLHGGVPSKAKTIDDVAYAHVKHPRETHLEEILWSDPEEDLKGTQASPRGAGRLFGEDVTTKFLEMLNVKALIRGHEPCDLGFRINHFGKILTLFSRKGDPYFNAEGAFLQFDLAAPLKDAFGLQRFVRSL